MTYKLPTIYFVLQALCLWFRLLWDALNPMPDGAKLKYLSKYLYFEFENWLSLNIKRSKFMHTLHYLRLILMSGSYKCHYLVIGFIARASNYLVIGFFARASNYLVIGFISRASNYLVIGFISRASNYLVIGFISRASN